MESRNSVVSVVDALNDIDFTIVWPVLAQCPESRPETAGAGRHMVEVGNPKTFVPSLGAFETDRRSSDTVWIVGILGVDVHIEDAVLNTGEATVQSGLVVNVLNEAMVRVGAGEPGEFGIIGKVVGGIACGDLVGRLSGSSSRKQRQNSSECGARPQKE